MIINDEGNADSCYHLNEDQNDGSSDKNNNDNDIMLPQNAFTT